MDAGLHVGGDRHHLAVAVSARAEHADARPRRPAGRPGGGSAMVGRAAGLRPWGRAAAGVPLAHAGLSGAAGAGARLHDHHQPLAAGAVAAPVRVRAQECAAAGHDPVPAGAGPQAMDLIFVKYLHVLSSTMLFGTGIGSAFYLFFISWTRDARVVAVVARHVVIA